MRKCVKKEKNRPIPNLSAVRSRKPEGSKLPGGCRKKRRIKSLSKTWSKERIGQSHKAPTQLTGKNEKHRIKVDAEEQKVCQKNRKAEKMQQVKYEGGSKKAWSRLEEWPAKWAQTSGEQLSKSRTGTGR